MSRGLLLAVILGLVGCGGENPRVEMVTTKGTVTIELYESQAPATVKNFLQYVDDKFYDGKIFHRVVDKFLILGGGYDTKYTGAITRPPIKSESTNGLKNLRGTIAMSRSIPNDPHSATSQFYINIADRAEFDPNPAMPGGNTVFGKIIAGMDVVDKISRAPVHIFRGEPFVPVDQVVIESIRRAPATK